MLKWLKKRFDRLFFLENWKCIVMRSTFESFLNKKIQQNDIIFETKESNFRFFADPFFIQKDNKIYLFLEEYKYIQKKGIISYFSFDSDLKNEKYGNIDIDYQKHFSFPFIFEKENETYCIFETYKNKSIDFYKSTNFPNKWEFQRTILQGEYLDTIVYKEDDVYFLFTSSIINGTDCELHLFYSLDMINWIKHVKSPVRSGFFGSRMAGNLFIDKNKIIRPAQISEKCYGDGICFYNIIILTKDDYQEELISMIMARDIGLDGIHSFNILDDLIVIDVKKHKYSIVKILHKIIRIFFLK